MMVINGFPESLRAKGISSRDILEENSRRYIIFPREVTKITVIDPVKRFESMGTRAEL